MLGKTQFVVGEGIARVTLCCQFEIVNCLAPFFNASIKVADSNVAKGRIVFLKERFNDSLCGLALFGTQEFFGLLNRWGRICRESLYR